MFYIGRNGPWACSKYMAEYLPHNVKKHTPKNILIKWLLLLGDVFSNYLVIFPATLSPCYVRVCLFAWYECVCANDLNNLSRSNCNCIWHLAREQYCNIVLHCIVLYCIVMLYCAVLYCIVLCCVVLCCVVLYSIVLLYCIVLHCITMYCVVPSTTLLFLLSPSQFFFFFFLFLSFFSFSIVTSRQVLLLLSQSSQSQSSPSSIIILLLPFVLLAILYASPPGRNLTSPPLF